MSEPLKSREFVPDIVDFADQMAVTEKALSLDYMISFYY